jgi:indolepyruvate ferredoxin oxidoreductase beta subunit
MLERIRSELPEPAHAFAIEGARRLSDYQDRDYAALYLDRLHRVRACDRGGQDWRLTREVARYLALWMSYEDTIRVADLKVRASRFERVRDEVKATAEQPLAITEYMHPRLQEVAETLPAALGRRLLASKNLAARLEPLFRKGRHVRTSSLGWFAVLSLLAGFRRWRRGTLRYQQEQARIENWLELVIAAAAVDQEAAAELVECQRLIKGYSDTFERGLRNFNTIVDTWPSIRGRDDAAAILKQLREAALADEEAKMLEAAIADLRLAS